MPKLELRNLFLAIWGVLCLLSMSCSEDTEPVSGDHGPAVPDSSVRDGKGLTPDQRADVKPTTDSQAKKRTACKAAQALLVYQDTGSHSGWLPQIAWSKTQYGLTWTQQIAGSPIKYQVALIRISKSGALQGSVQLLTKDNTADSYDIVSIAEVDTGFAITWSDVRVSSSSPDIYFLRLNDQGQRLSTTGAVCTTAWCGEVKITSSGKASYPHLVQRAYVDLKSPVSVKELGLAWADSRNLTTTPYPPYTSGRKDIYFKVLKSDGSEKLAESRITTDSSKKDPSWPKLAYNGTDYIIVWRDMPSISSQELYFAMLSATGKVKGTETLLVKNSGLLSSPPDLVWSGSDYGISFSENPSSSSGSIRISRITQAGTLMAMQTVSGQGNPCTPTVSYNGEFYAVAWQSSCGQTGSQLTFALLDNSGTPFKSDGTSCTGSTDPKCGMTIISPVTDGTDSFPEMISVDGNYAVTWMNAPKYRIYFSNITCKAP